MSKPETPMRAIVSPEYRAKCIDWAVKVAPMGEKPENIVAAAKRFYDYVYEEPK